MSSDHQTFEDSTPLLTRLKPFEDGALATPSPSPLLHPSEHSRISHVAPSPHDLSRDGVDVGESLRQLQGSVQGMRAIAQAMLTAQHDTASQLRDLNAALVTALTDRNPDRNPDRDPLVSRTSGVGPYYSLPGVELAPTTTNA